MAAMIVAVTCQNLNMGKIKSKNSKTCQKSWIT